MWEASAFGPAHEAVRSLGPPSVQVTLDLLRETPAGRRVIVVLRGPRRPCRAVLARLLPELVLDARASSETVNQLRAVGTLPPVAAADLAEPPASASLWVRLRALEAGWLGADGMLLLVALRDGHLAAKGLGEAPAEGTRAEVRARELGAALRLFRADEVSVAGRAFAVAGADALPAWQLKRTEIEAARAALALGYYENPRRCTMEDIARVLGITKSAVYHRIHGLEQKSVRRLVHQHGALTGPPPTELPAPPAAALHHVEQALIPASVARPTAWAPRPP